MPSLPETNILPYLRSRWAPDDFLTAIATTLQELVFQSFLLALFVTTVIETNKHCFPWSLSNANGDVARTFL
jgi:hypothetical protein